MILIDTSVWADHFRMAEPQLVGFAQEEIIQLHPLVLGELAMGNFANRTKVLNWLSELIPAAVASDDEVLRVVESQVLYGKGLGYVDAHLIASAKLTPEVQFWSRDKRLVSAAFEAGITVLAETRH
jgi:predicted nucleic acid-binding protein